MKQPQYESVASRLTKKMVLAVLATMIIVACIILTVSFHAVREEADGRYEAIMNVVSAIYALNHSDRDWTAYIKAIRSLTATPQQIREVTEYTLSNGGIDYAIQKMQDLKTKALNALPTQMEESLRAAFTAYLELIINRSK